MPGSCSWSDPDPLKSRAQFLNFEQNSVHFGQLHRRECSCLLVLVGIFFWMWDVSQLSGSETWQTNRMWNPWIQMILGDKTLILTGDCASDQFFHGIFTINVRFSARFCSYVSSKASKFSPAALPTQVLLSRLGFWKIVLSRVGKSNTREILG